MLARGRVEREVGDGDSALAAFQGYLEKGPNRSLGLLEVARTMFLLGRFDGVAPYFEGAASADSATAAGYRGDLATIAGDSILREFDHTNGQLRVEYLKRFWSERDRVELRADGERLREHYRRLFYARKNFQLTSLNRHYDIVERFRSGSRDFDDRGIIYIRHGEPSSRASYAAPGLEPNESWRYSRPDGDMIFHFMAREDVQDFKLVESLFDVLGFSNALALRGGLAGSEGDPMAQQLLLSREQLAPIYGRLQAAGRISTGRYQTEERAVGQESIALGTTSDSYELRFPEELTASSEVLAVGRDSTGTQVQIAYAIAGSTLEPVMVTRGYLYSVRVRFVATDRFHKVVARSTPPGISWRRRRCPKASTWWAACRSRCRQAGSTTASRSSTAKAPASSSPATPCGSASPPPMPWRSATWCWAAGTPTCSGAAPRKTPWSSIRSGPSSGRRTWSCTTRSRG
jgi:GWxTD domain-containing protein